MGEEDQSLHKKASIKPFNEAAEKEKQKRIVIIIIFSVSIFILLLFFVVIRVRLSKNSEVEITPTPTQTKKVVRKSQDDEMVIPTNKPTTKPSLIPTSTLTPTPKNVAQTVTINAMSSLDGYRTSSATGDSAGTIRVGRNDAFIARGFISFDLSSVLNSTEIERAVMRIYQVKNIGNPYVVGGRMVVDHIELGSTLDDEDYNKTPLSSGFATISDNGEMNYKDVDVTEKVRNDKEQNRSYSQYRLHFETESLGGTSEGDFALFESSDNSENTGKYPQLIISIIKE